MNNIAQSIAEFAKYDFCSLGLSDLDEILTIEQAVYTHPWTFGNFVDTFQHEHEAWGIRNDQGNLVAYFFLMPVVDELHLLTFAVDAKKQKLGYGYILLRKMMELAREKKFASIMLEVRVSNERAIAVYQRFGFVEIGRRKGYYPAQDLLREDAIVMRIMTQADDFPNAE
jgi:ribosomal-protein-alanine N-acetyltransferase